ncbi:MAG: hypothetical protein ABI905_17475 [Betaproteobacteria bacterium]
MKSLKSETPLTVRFPAAKRPASRAGAGVFPPGFAAILFVADASTALSAVKFRALNH